MTSEPGSAAMEQFEPLEKVFIRWARGADGSLSIRKWSQFPFDGATEYGDPVVLTRERDEAREALKPETPMDRSAQFQDGFRNAKRRCIAWLHSEAKRMNDPHAAMVLENAAGQLGNSALSKEKPE